MHFNLYLCNRILMHKQLSLEIILVCQFFSLSSKWNMENCYTVKVIRVFFFGGIVMQQQILAFRVIVAFKLGYSSMHLHFGRWIVWNAKPFSPQKQRHFGWIVINIRSELNVPSFDHWIFDAAFTSKCDIQ